MTAKNVLSGFEAGELYMNNFYLVARGLAQVDFVELATNANGHYNSWACAPSGCQGFLREKWKSLWFHGEQLGLLLWTIATPLVVFIILLFWIIIQFKMEAQLNEKQQKDLKYKDLKQKDQIQKDHFDYDPVITCLIFLFLYFQPGIFQQLVSVLACRQIGGGQYISANVAYQCYTDEHNFYLLTMVGPLLLFLVFIIPLFFAIIIKKNKNLLNKSKNYIRWGTLYRQYAKHGYYWEFVKMGLKMMVYLFLAVFQTEIEVKGLLSSLFLVFYVMWFSRLQPYQNRGLNNAQRLSNEVLLLSYISALCIYQNPFEWMQLILFLILLVINLYFFFFCLSKILNSLMRKIALLLDPARIQLHKNHPQFCQKHGISPLTIERRQELYYLLKDTYYYWTLRKNADRSISIIEAGLELKVFLESQQETQFKQEVDQRGLIQERLLNQLQPSQITEKLIQKQYEKLKQNKLKAQEKQQKIRMKQGERILTQRQTQKFQINLYAELKNQTVTQYSKNDSGRQYKIKGMPNLRCQETQTGSVFKAGQPKIEVYLKPLNERIDSLYNTPSSREDGEKISIFVNENQ